MTFDRNKYHREWYQKHKASVLSSVRGWLKTPNGKAYQKARGVKFRKEFPTKHRDGIKRSNDRLKLEVLTRYSVGSVPECACCGETILDFLTLDHVNGGGAAERAKYGHRGGTAQYRSLRKRGFPPGYQVLCWNCNCAIGKRGVCPHKEVEIDKRKPSIRVGRGSNVHSK